MGEDTVELIDYFRVIWKRKILIIVGTLVCMVAGGVISLRLPEIYRAEALIKIGKTLVSSPSPSPSLSLELIDSPALLIKTIPVKYVLDEEEYGLRVEHVSETSLVKIVLEGPHEKKTKEILDEVVGKLTADHLRKTESSIQFYKILIGKLEADIKEIQNDLALEMLEFEEMNIKVDKEMNILMDKEKNAEVDINEADPFTLMMIQNRSIAIQNNILRMKELVKNNLLRMKLAAQNNLKQSRISISSIKNDILMHKLTTKSIMENKTRIVGDVKNDVIEPKKKRNIVLAGAVGLIMFLFLAFFIEYLGNVMEREKEEEEI